MSPSSTTSLQSPIRLTTQLPLPPPPITGQIRASNRNQNVPRQRLLQSQLSINFNVYDYIHYFYHERNIDYNEWKRCKETIACRLVCFCSYYYDAKNFKFKTLSVLPKYCIFGVVHKSSEHTSKHLFIVYKKTDNIIVLACKIDNEDLYKIPKDEFIEICKQN